MKHIRKFESHREYHQKYAITTYFWNDNEVETFGAAGFEYIPSEDGETSMMGKFEKEVGPVKLIIVKHSHGHTGREDFEYQLISDRDGKLAIVLTKDVPSDIITAVEQIRQKQKEFGV